MQTTDIAMIVIAILSVVVFIADQYLSHKLKKYLNQDNPNIRHYIPHSYDDE